MKKLIVKSLKMFLFLFVFGAIFWGQTEIAQATQEVYFDESGNLFFSTYNKKATSGVKYRTIGWVIKRYNDAIDAPGQYHVKVANDRCVYEMDDPLNEGYVYTLFQVDGEYILDCVGKVSEAWKSQLEKYGGYVYLDAIMTVMVNGVLQGTINSAGNMNGEVYITYEGIRNARGWADGDKLKAYYGLRVKYPYLTSGGTFQMRDVSAIEGKHSSTLASSFVVGEGTKDRQTYDVGQGVPVGESLYISGKADCFRYDVEYETVTGYVNIPVQVITPYDLRWTDTSGNPRRDMQNVSRWYMVSYNYEYVKVKSVKIYGLKSVLFDGACFEDITENVNAEVPDYYLSHADSSAEHISCNQSVTCQVDSQIIYSKNNQRPDIPDENQRNVAKDAVSQPMVWSDLLQINGVTVLSNKRCEQKAMTFSAYDDMPQQSFYLTGLEIPFETLNAEGYGTVARMSYEAKDYSVYYQTNSDINSVTVHTPVLADMHCSAPKDQNESIFPQRNDIVIGGSGTLVMTGIGQHLDIPGYGNRSYAGYAKKLYVKFPFAVFYKNKKYDPDQWITVGTNLANIKISEDVEEGTYTVESMVAAINTPAYYLTPDMLPQVSQDTANLQLDYYGAYNSYEVNAIGKLFGLTVLWGDKRYCTGANAVFPEILQCEDEKLPVAMEKTSENQWNVRIGLYAYAIGDTVDELVEMDLSYYVFEPGEDGSYVRCPVDVYMAEDEKFNAETLTPLQNQLAITAEQARMVRQGVYYFEGLLELSGHLVVVPAGTDISDISMMSEYILRDRQLVVHTDVYATDTGGRKLSYENKANEAQGYCNMWSYEGYLKDNAGNMPLEYGDILVLNMEGAMKNSGIVIGTH